MSTSPPNRPRRLRTEIPKPLDSALVASLSEADLGLRRGVVALAAPSPRWAQAFTGVANALDVNWPAGIRAIEHIGSTAVPGLAAKPILDLAIGFEPAANLDRIHHWLLSLGFLCLGEKDAYRPDLMYGFEIEPGIRLVNAHAIEHGSTEWTGYLAFRNYLRTHPVERDAYGALKRSVALQNPGDRIGYLAGKAEFIRARRAR
ncbi:GrpB family protein [Glutamicibacter arilaitensis]|uniref:GrpB family protein n=1 Tax=Glutamicibacter arilaitensis TaxID=256701 RepID=UPI00384BFC24